VTTMILTRTLKPDTHERATPAKGCPWPTTNADAPSTNAPGVCSVNLTRTSAARSASPSATNGRSADARATTERKPKHHWRITGRSAIEKDHFIIRNVFDNWEPTPPNYTVHFNCIKCGIHNNTTHQWIDGAWVNSWYKTSVVCDPIANRVGQFAFDESQWERDDE
jgi:hypothetical protein